MLFQLPNAIPFSITDREQLEFTAKLMHPLHVCRANLVPVWAWWTLTVFRLPLARKMV